jgi:signal transduction histidine kinase
VSHPDSNSRPRLLIAEDERITAHHLRHALTRFGYEVVAVTGGGEAAIEEAEQKRPDLLLADIGLKGTLDGIEVASVVRQRWGIPTVFLTAYTDSETMERARLSEPYGYLTKPFAEDELHATIEIALQQKKLLEDRQRQSQDDLITIERNKEEINVLAAKLVTAQEEERERVARDLHDDIGQRIALLSIKLSTLAEQLSLEPEKAQCNEILADLDALSEDVRNLSHNLHPAALEHLGLAPALRGLVEEFEERESIRTRFSARELPASLPNEVKIALYRIVQEALTNIAKHADAKSVDIALIGGSNDIYLSVRDIGRGFQVETARTKPGLGLMSMTQRARLIGGTLDIHSEPGVGTRIDVCVPKVWEKDIVFTK